MRHLTGLVVVAAAVALGVTPLGALADVRHIDPAQSKLTVHVFKTGLFAFAADNHEISAPISAGEMSGDPPSSVKLTVETAHMTVLDPQTAADKRAQVQARMVGPDVLDVDKYPTIEFTSTSIQAAPSGGLDVTGALTIHGTTRTIHLHVTEANGRYTGSTTLKQTDFGIRPITIAGGTVKVKDEIRIDFDIAMQM
jgi:polyisoprenoid-binding protein YceI